MKLIALTAVAGFWAAATLQAQSQLGMGAPPSPGSPASLTLSGAPGPYQVQGATALGPGAAWRVVTNLTLASEPASFSDPAAAPGGTQFYRARTLPPLGADYPDPARWSWIRPGVFVMGSPAEESARAADENQTQVTLTGGFYMGRYEVTQLDYLELTGNNPSYFNQDSNRPVERVSWLEATNYCVLLTARERAAGRLAAGWAFRLPTEAEWEFACRAGTTTAFHYGTALRDGMADFDSHWEYDSTLGETYVEAPAQNLERTATGGSYAPNALGLYDMHGNVWEWCQDWYAPSYPGGSVTNATGPATGSYRVFRGGDARHGAWYARSACRWTFAYGTRAIYVGIRPVLSPAP